MRITGNLGRWMLAAAALALVAGLSFVGGAPVHAQSLQGVPVVRFYGNITLNGQKPVTNLGVTSTIGNTVCSATQTNAGWVNGGASNNDGEYFQDIQSIPGCTTPGSTVVFTVTNGANGTYKAQQTGTIPSVPGTPVRLDLNFVGQATPTATAPPPPPPPTKTPTTAPPPPPAPAPSAAATPAAKPVVQQAPAAAKAAPAYAGPAVAGARLPNTGTGGLLDEQTSTTGWALLVIVLMAFGVGATGLVAHRRRG